LAVSTSKEFVDLPVKFDKHFREMRLFSFLCIYISPLPTFPLSLTYSSDSFPPFPFPYPVNEIGTICSHRHEPHELPPNSQVCEHAHSGAQSFVVCHMSICQGIDVICKMPDLKIYQENQGRNLGGEK
jgi:hypothetical protein